MHTIVLKRQADGKILDKIFLKNELKPSKLKTFILGFVSDSDILGLGQSLLRFKSMQN